MIMTILAICGPIGSDFREFSEQCYKALAEASVEDALLENEGAIGLKNKLLLIDRSSYDSTESLLSAIKKLTAPSLQDVVEQEPCDIIIFGADIFLDATLREQCDVKVFLELDADLCLSKFLKQSAANNANVAELSNQYFKEIQPLNEKIRLSARYADLRRPQASEFPLDDDLLSPLERKNTQLIDLLIDSQRVALKSRIPSLVCWSRDRLWQPQSQPTKVEDPSSSLGMVTL